MRNWLFGWPHVASGTQPSRRSTAGGARKSGSPEFKALELRRIPGKGNAKILKRRIARLSTPNAVLDQLCLDRGGWLGAASLRIPRPTVEAFSRNGKKKKGAHFPTSVGPLTFFSCVADEELGIVIFRLDESRQQTQKS